MEQCFTHMEKGQSNVSFSSVSLPWSSSQHRAVTLHVLILCHRTKNLIPSSQGTDLVEGLARCCMMHTLKQNKEDSLSLKQE